MRWLVSVVAAGSILSVGILAPGETPDGLFDPDADHSWNRLHSHLHTRTIKEGERYDQESLEPVFVAQSSFLTEGPSHRKALTLLDQFLEKHQESSLENPLKRAILQRDLWAIFEKTAGSNLKRQNKRRELQKRVVQVMRRVALTSEEIEQLPDNLSAAVESKRFPSKYDSAEPNRAFLPVNLLETTGPWVMLGDRWGWKGNYLAAPNHAKAVNGRAVFLVLLRLPGGRQKTIQYLKALEKVQFHRDDVPQFPTGTQVALLRRMMLVDRQGELRLTPITENIQLRVYEDLKAPSMFEFTLNRKSLFEDPGASLHAVADDEINYFDIGTVSLSRNSRDPFEKPRPKADSKPIVMKSCIGCHAGPGIYGLQSMFAPHYSHAAVCVPDDLDDQVRSTVKRTHQTYSWGLLQGLWTSGLVH